MKKQRPVTQSRIQLDNWIKGLQGQPGWDGLRECLEQISAGQDANKVFGLNRGRGRNATQAAATFKKNMIPVWIASAMRELQITRSEAIEKAANTGKIGDGKIFVCELEQAIRIRTGENGAEAL